MSAPLYSNHYSWKCHYIFNQIFIKCWILHYHLKFESFSAFHLIDLKTFVDSSPLFSLECYYWFYHWIILDHLQINYFGSARKRIGLSFYSPHFRLEVWVIASCCLIVNWKLYVISPKCPPPSINTFLVICVADFGNTEEAIKGRTGITKRFLHPEVENEWEIMLNTSCTEKLLW